MVPILSVTTGSDTHFLWGDWKWWAWSPIVLFLTGSGGCGHHSPMGTSPPSLVSLGPNIRVIKEVMGVVSSHMTDNLLSVLH